MTMWLSHMTKMAVMPIQGKSSKFSYLEPNESTALCLGIKGSTMYIRPVILCTTRSNLIHYIRIWEKGDFSITTTKGDG